jgi:hypothetical protein
MKVTRVAGLSRAVILGAAVELGQRSGKVGWFPAAQYPDGTPVAGVAAVHELGSATQGIPPRAFFRPTAAEQANEWGRISAGYARMVMRGDIAPKAMFEGLCLAAEGAVRETITKLNSPPLAQATVDARKRRLAPGTKVAKKPAVMGIEKPLVDSGLMLATLTSQVE